MSGTRRSPAGRPAPSSRAGWPITSSACLQPIQRLLLVRALLSHSKAEVPAEADTGAREPASLGTTTRIGGSHEQSWVDESRRWPVVAKKSVESPTKEDGDEA